ncbi:MAG: DnaD domain protein [Anaerolineaceae bacterium]|nr:DnaD domain protein [Anaerolineaceae bacterium]
MSEINFNGFNAGKTHLTPIPYQFFREIVPQIHDVIELKVALYVFWLLSLQEKEARFITNKDFLDDKVFMDSLGDHPEQVLQSALEKATFHKILIKAKGKEDQSSEIYFLNSEKGRSLAKAIEEGKWTPDWNNHIPQSLDIERPNIYQLYEENIGPLTPIITDMLRDAESTYKPGWIEEAIHIAVEKNVRNWRYIEAILKSWQEKGKYEKDRRDDETGSEKYLKGKYSDIIEH